MEFYKKRIMISRQGKAINHLHSTFFATPIKRKPPSESNDGNFLKKTEELKTTKKQQKNNSEKILIPEVTQLSSSFKAISREQFCHTTRNRTESPKVGLYNPK